MALIWQCYLDDLLLDSEPINMSSISLSLIRDEELHGIGAEATTDPLEFIGNAIPYLDNIKDTEGLKANVVFTAKSSCGPEEEFEIFIQGKLNLSDRKQKCGSYCSIQIPMETVTCEQIIKNKMDQSVNMDSNVSSNGVSALNAYNDLNFPVQLPTRVLPYKTEGYVSVTEPPFAVGPTVGGATQIGIVRPDYQNVVASNIKQTELTGAEIVGFWKSSVISPNVLWDERLANFPNPVLITGRLKGGMVFSNTGSGNLGEAFLVVFRGELTPDQTLVDISGNLDPFFVGNILHTQIYHFTDAFRSFSFDVPYSYTWNPTDSGADGIYAGIIFNSAADGTMITTTWDPVSFFKAETIKAVPPTWTEGYMIHETLSRAVESITDGCAKVKSQYYGRTDSQPFNFPSDGCGGLRMVTSGLKIRNAANPVFAPSFKELVTGLQDIDNIGMGIEVDDTPGGQYVVRIENLDFFYRNAEILKCPFVPNGEFDIEPSRFYSKILIGYKKWQTEANFGLDEFNSTREYRTSLTSVSNILDKQTDLVAGEYAIEITREQQFADTSSADTTYDDDTFILCMKRIGGAYGYGYPYNGIEVEQAVINFPTNIFNPTTTYNYRISPARNLMRWARTILASYPNIVDSDNIIYFSTGAGNILASGELADSYLNDCVLEQVPISEGGNISATMFKDAAKVKPLWINETFTFDFPLSISDYKKIKLNPYGYISFQCGAGAWDQGWIKEIKYRPVQGLATFTLRRRQQ